MRKAGLLLFIFAVFPFGVYAAVPVKKTVQKKPEAHLLIPKIKLDVVIQDSGLTKEGVMAVPNSNTDVGWFSLGTRPGQEGSAVIGGHNRWRGKPGAFVRLDQLKKGDALSVVNAKGHSVSFMVREMRTYDAKDFDNEIFLSASGAHLNLITCSGVWDPLTKSYTTRLVIFTDLIQF